MKIDGIEYKEPKTGAWDKYSLYQFTSRGTAEGIKGNVDLNFTNLSREELVGKGDIPSTPQSGFIKYSQNDPRWKNDKMGNSRWTLGAKGCTTTSICTLASYFGDTITPKELATHKELYTADGLVIWKQLNGILKTLNFLYRYYSFSETVVDDALIKDPNKCVLLQVNNKTHWVSALKKVYGGYVCSNPWTFPATNKTYKFKEITGMAVLIRK